MSNILVCTIIRNQQQDIQNWCLKLNKLIRSDKSNTYYVSVYQNDSTDATKQLLQYCKFPNVKHSIVSQNIQTQYLNRFNTVKRLGVPSNGNIGLIKRLQNLSSARNRTLQSITKAPFQYVLFVQCDIDYQPQSMRQFIHDAILNGYDIASPMSIHNSELYDKWATRLHQNQQWFEPTQYWNSNTIIPCYSTFNCFCLYKAIPMYSGVKFDYINSNGDVDCDTVIICQKYRQFGLTNIILNKHYSVLAK